MKKQVAEFVKKLGFQSHYAGSNQIMHVHVSSVHSGSRAKGSAKPSIIPCTIATLKSKVTKQFGVLNFKIQ